jgi:hypothetical protein
MVELECGSWAKKKSKVDLITKAQILKIEKIVIAILGIIQFISLRLSSIIMLLHSS